MNLLQKEPYYTIELTAVACKFEILVNDVSVASFEVDGQLSPNVPINYAIYKSGKQNITVNILPLKGQKYLSPSTEFSYTVKLFDVTNDEFTFIEENSSHTFEKLKADEMRSQLSHSGQFSADIPYQMTHWENSRDLLSISKDKDYISNKLNAAYKEIVSLLKTKQYDLFYDKIKYRERNMAVSMYLSKEEVNARINSLIEDLDEGFVVTDLPVDRVLKIYGKGKLATYKKFNGEPALVLSNPKTSEEIMLEFMFHIPETKEEFEVI